MNGEMEKGSVIKFLLVDDIDANLLALEALLKRPGLVLLKARSGPEALELLLTNEVGLALLDVQMPGMDGFELAHLMRGTERTRHVPIIFITAGTADQRRRFEGYDAGAVDFLHKPIEEHVLKSKANVFFDLALHRAQLRESEQRSQQIRSELVRTVEELEVARRAAMEEMEKVVEARNEQEKLNNALRTSEEALRDADRRKDEFLAILAHELRNPLAPIRSGLQLLRESSGNAAEPDKVIPVLERQVGQMVQLVDDLLDLSRVSRGVIELRQRPMDVHEAMEQAIEATRPLLESKGHRLELHFHDQPLLLNADPTRIAQVFGNLLDNAAKYTDPSGVVFITTRILDGQAHITFTDSGIGISTEHISKVFEMFGQVDRSHARTRGGLGIGLHIVEQLVHMHGGNIHASSEGIGKGSSFTVTLPLASEPVHVQEEPVAKTIIKQMRVLIADDNEDGVTALGKLLEIAGHNVKVAFSGEEALAAGEAFHPDAIILDIGMPGMDGYETCRRMRELPWGRDVHMIALTGWGQEEDKRRTREAGFDHHLVKPIRSKDVKEVLAQGAPK